MTISRCKDEIINAVMNLSDADNLIIATFIAGMQAKESTAACHSDDDRQPRKPPTGRSA